MISQAYIFGALGKAAFKEDEKWYVLDNDAPNAVRAWHTFDNNYLALSDPETIPVPEGKNLDDIKQLLALETRKQEALTLALQLMDTSIQEETLKTEIAQLLGEYARDKEIFQFLENRLLTTIVPDSFDPSFASHVCRTLKLNEIARVYETLTALASAIRTFYTAWVKAAKNHFPDVETADAAFSLMTSTGIARTFVQSIAIQDKVILERATASATLLFRIKDLASDNFFSALKTDLITNFKAILQDSTKYLTFQEVCDIIVFGGGVLVDVYGKDDKSKNYDVWYWQFLNRLEIKGHVLNLPFNELSQRFDELSSNQPIVILSRPSVNNKGIEAVKFLQSLGYQDVALFDVEHPAITKVEKKHQLISGTSLKQ